MNSKDLSTQLWEKLEAVLGRSVPFSRGRSDKLLELGQDPAATWSEGPGDPIKADGSWETGEPPMEVIMASLEWDSKFRTLAQDIAAEAGVFA